jgi:hypothetical protein
VVLDGFVGSKVDADHYGRRGPDELFAEFQLDTVLLLPDHAEVEVSGGDCAAGCIGRYDRGPPAPLRLALDIGRRA